MKPKAAKVCILVFGVIILLFISWNVYTRRQLNKNGVYVIGTLVKIEGAKASLRGFITFKYKTVEYNLDFLSNNISKKDLGRRYIIKIIRSCPTGDISVEEDLLVPDSLKESPVNGWDSVPVINNQ